MTATIRRTYTDGVWTGVKWVTVHGRGGSIGIVGVERVGFSQQTPRPPFLFELTEDEYDARWQDMMDRLEKGGSYVVAPTQATAR